MARPNAEIGTGASGLYSAQLLKVHWRIGRQARNRVCQFRNNLLPVRGLGKSNFQCPYAIRQFRFYQSDGIS